MIFKSENKILACSNKVIYRFKITEIYLFRNMKYSSYKLQCVEQCILLMNKII